MLISSDYILCRGCNTRVAYMEDYIATFLEQGIFKRVFNVEVSSDTVNNHPILNGSTLVNAYCVQCKELLGGEFIAVLQPDEHGKERRFWMNLSKLSLPAIEDNADLDEDAPDQDGDTTDLDEDAPNQEEDTTDLDEDTPDQDIDTDEEDLGTNEEYADQDGDTTEKIGDTADQYGDTTEQDGDANEKNTNQDLGANQQNADQDGDANEQVAKEQDMGANEQNVDQDGGSNEQNHDEDGSQPMKQMKI